MTGCICQYKAALPLADGHQVKCCTPQAGPDGITVTPGGYREARSFDRFAVGFDSKLVKGDNTSTQRCCAILYRQKLVNGLQGLPQTCKVRDA